MSDRVLEARILGGDHNGDIVFIPRISLIPSAKSADFNFILKRRQFPVRLAFAMTINKAQGQSVKFVGLDLRVPVFSHGQLYVALSRATCSRRIQLLLGPNTSKTTNVVFAEVLIW
jgi:ATP-dependent exoDNAse (exonuclease V) alpha subunit